MDCQFVNNQFMISTSTEELEENIDTIPENGDASPPSTIFNDMKNTSASSPRKSRRDIHKRVVSVPIKDVEGSRLKGESSTPPYDSWAWRKYGQKPIKGSPYPRGYYRCSSSKGCPARKQVERNRLDPTMLVVTYSCEHNHPWPASRNHHSASSKPEKPGTVKIKPEQEAAPEEKFAGLGDESLMASDEFRWFGDMETTTSTVLESPIFAERSGADADMAMLFTMREEDESLYADLGELPECSVVFRGVGPGVEIC
ncbi:hypothetical protein I3843_10G059500 [Carya illinoinensis]|nr:hypothetical protein I3843_10G059500 [Carya illinoinensis]